MKIYLVRHAIAGERDPLKWPDDSKRPLTSKGEKQFKRVATRLNALFKPPSRVLTSPYTRAWRTAELLYVYASWPQAQRSEALEPAQPPARALAAIAHERDDAVLAMVGHEPALSGLAAFMLGGPGAKPTFRFKKGGLACIEFSAAVAPGAGKLRWLLTPRALIS